MADDFVRESRYMADVVRETRYMADGPSFAPTQVKAQLEDEEQPLDSSGNCR
jgi:hypothetical protein